MTSNTIAEVVDEIIVYESSLSEYSNYDAKIKDKQSFMKSFRKRVTRNKSENTDYRNFSESDKNSDKANAGPLVISGLGLGQKPNRRKRISLNFFQKLFGKRKNQENALTNRSLAVAEEKGNVDEINSNYEDVGENLKTGVEDKVSEPIEVPEPIKEHNVTCGVAEPPTASANIIGGYYQSPKNNMLKPTTQYDKKDDHNQKHESSATCSKTLHISDTQIQQNYADVYQNEDLPTVQNEQKFEMQAFVNVVDGPAFRNAEHTTVCEETELKVVQEDVSRFPESIFYKTKSKIKGVFGEEEVLHLDSLAPKEKVILKDDSISSLPSISKDDLLKLVKCHANNTMLIKVAYTSAERPAFYPSSTTPYPYYSSRNSTERRSGTGVLMKVIKYTEADGVFCPCLKLCNGKDCTRQWGEIQIITAKHLVYDNSEAKCSTAFIGCDSPDCLGETLWGCKADTRMIGDGCLLTCYTHDMWLVDHLEKICEKFKNLCEKINKQFQQLQDVVVVVTQQTDGGKKVFVGDMPQNWSRDGQIGVDSLHGIRTTYYRRAAVYVLRKEFPTFFQSNLNMNDLTLQDSMQSSFLGVGVPEGNDKAEAQTNLFWVDCEKNPKHKDFIPIRELTLEHIPLSIQEVLWEIIQSLAGITVTVCVLLNVRSQAPIETGSGRILNVEKFNNKERKCLCLYCKRSGTLTKWAKLTIETTANVFESVRDILEIRGNQEMVSVTVDGVELTVVQTIPFNIIECVTHNTAEVSRFEKANERFIAVNQEIKKELSLTVVVSHPHGCSKQVSFGYLKHQISMSGFDYNTERYRDRDYWVKYVYSTQTCPGSSGAYVYTLGDLFCPRLHSGAYTALNYAGEYLAPVNR